MPYRSHVMHTVGLGLPKGANPGSLGVPSLANMNYPGGCSRIDQTLTSHWRHAPTPRLFTVPAVVRLGTPDWLVHAVKGEAVDNLSLGLNPHALYWREVRCKTGNMLYQLPTSSTICDLLTGLPETRHDPSILKDRMYSDRERPSKSKQSSQVRLLPLSVC